MYACELGLRVGTHLLYDHVQLTTLYTSILVQVLVLAQQY